MNVGHHVLRQVKAAQVYLKVAKHFGRVMITAAKSIPLRFSRESRTQPKQKGISNRDKNVKQLPSIKLTDGAARQQLLKSLIQSIISIVRSLWCTGNGLRHSIGKSKALCSETEYEELQQKRQASNSNIYRWLRSNNEEVSSGQRKQTTL